MSFENNFWNGAIWTLIWTISEYVSESVNYIKWNEEAEIPLYLYFHCKVFNTSQQKFLLLVQLKSSFPMSYLVIVDVTEICFAIQLMPC